MGTGRFSRWLLSPDCSRQGQGSKSPSRCAYSKQQSHFIPKGTKPCFEFQRQMPQEATARLTPQKCLMNYHGRHQLHRLMTKRSLAMSQWKRINFLLALRIRGIEQASLTTAPLPPHTKPHHGSFPSYIFFQWLFINLSRADSASVLCFICRTMTTK